MRKGFTFIELIIYVAIVSIVMTALIPFAWNVIEGGTKSATQQEVFANARFISEKIRYEIRNSIGINSVSASSISLVTSIAGTNPTIIDLSGGNVRIKQGAGSTISLNSTDTRISSLIFTNYTSGDNKTKHIGFTLTVNANYTGAGARQEYNESTTIESSAEVRSN